MGRDKIAMAIAANPDLVERAAIMEFESGMSRHDAERAALQNWIDEKSEG
jgi:hypothetical protein